MKIENFIEREGDPKQFFEGDLERCELITSIVDASRVNGTFSRDTHLVLWRHVQDCALCLRNVIRATFVMGKLQVLPLPIFTNDPPPPKGSN